MQQRSEILKYLLDIESIIEELEKILNHHNSDFIDFSLHFISIRAVERDLMNIGEAVSKLQKLTPQLTISCASQIIGLRNMIVHAYDSIDPTVLWRILLKDIPILKLEVKALING